jgi:hypothetical protein
VPASLCSLATQFQNSVLGIDSSPPTEGRKFPTQATLHSLAGLVPWNRFFGLFKSLKILAL